MKIRRQTTSGGLQAAQASRGSKHFALHLCGSAFDDTGGNMEEEMKRLRLGACFAVVLLVANLVQASQPPQFVDVIRFCPEAGNGVGSYFIAANTTTNSIYVQNRNSSNVSVIDASTDSVVKTIPISSTLGTIYHPLPHGMDVDPITNRIYAVGGSYGTVSVIDGATSTVTGVIALPIRVDGVCVNPNTHRIYAMYQVDKTICVVDGVTDSLVATITLDGDSWLVDICVNPATNLIYAALRDGRVFVIDGGDNSIIDSIQVNEYQSQISVDSSTNRIYVAGYTYGDSLVRLYVIDGMTNCVADSVPLYRFSGGCGARVCVNQHSHRVYVAEERDIYVVNGVNDSLVDTVRIMDGYPANICVNPVTNCVYSVDQTICYVHVVDGSTNSHVKEIKIGDMPYSVCVNHNTQRLYTTSLGNRFMYVIDAENDSFVGSVKLFNHYSYGIAVDTSMNRIYPANWRGSPGIIPVVDGVTNSVVDTFSWGYVPRGVAVNPMTHRIYMTGSLGSGSVWTIGVFDGMGDSLITWIPCIVPIGGIAVNPSTDLIYATVANGGAIAVIDGATDSIVHEIMVGQDNWGVDVNPFSNHIYAVDVSNDTVFVIDGTTNSILDRIGGTIRCPTEIAANPLTDWIYVTSGQSNVFYAIDEHTHDVWEMSVGSIPSSIAVNPIMGRIYVVCLDEATIWVFEHFPGIEEENISRKESRLEIHPNPFTHNTVVQFGVRGSQPEADEPLAQEFVDKENTVLRIHDLSGRVVRTLSSRVSPSPPLRVAEWDGKNDSGKDVPPGAYFCKLTTKDYKATKKLILIK